MAEELGAERTQWSSPGSLFLSTWWRRWGLCSRPPESGSSNQSWNHGGSSGMAGVTEKQQPRQRGEEPPCFSLPSTPNLLASAPHSWTQQNACWHVTPEHGSLPLRAEQEKGKKGPWEPTSRGLPRNGAGDYYYFIGFFYNRQTEFAQGIWNFHRVSTPGFTQSTIKLPPNTLRFIRSLFAAPLSRGLKSNAWISFIILFTILPNANFLPTHLSYLRVRRYSYTVPGIF